jgi:hypothetical protein
MDLISDTAESFYESLRHRRYAGFRLYSPSGLAVRTIERTQHRAGHAGYLCPTGFGQRAQRVHEAAVTGMNSVPADQRLRASSYNPSGPSSFRVVAPEPAAR